MISIENLSKSYGGRILFDSVSFRINARERVGVVGRNGHGKTTLFRLVTGEVYPDSGLITTPKNYCIGCVRQQIKFSRDTVLAEGMTGLSKAEQDHHWKVEKSCLDWDLLHRTCSGTPENSPAVFRYG